MKKIMAVIFICLAVVPAAACKGGGASTRVELSAVFDGECTLSGDMTVRYVNDTETEITELKFNLFPAAFREGAEHPPVSPANEAKVYPEGVNYGGIIIEECRENGEIADWRIAGNDENILVISLKKGVFPSESTAVSVAFTVKIPKARHRFGSMDGCVNLGNWFPVLCVHETGGFYECDYSPFGDPFYSEAYDYSVSLTVPSEYTVAAGGKCALTQVDGPSTTYTYELKNYRDVAFVLSKEFNISSLKSGNTDIYYYAKGEHDSAVVNAVGEAVSLFSRLFGEYPFDSLSVVSTPFPEGGMEYPGIVFISDSLDKETAVEAAVHETAHQWWYAAVGNNQLETAYIDEGLAEYSVCLFFENTPSHLVSREGFMNGKIAEFRAFYGVYDQLAGKADGTMERPLSGFTSEYEYVETVYTKSAIMFDAFRSGVGDKRFFAGLSRFYSENKFGIADTPRLISAFERAGCDAEGFFTSWLEGKVII